MILPIELIRQLKPELSRMGVNWGEENPQPQTDRPICKGLFRGQVIAIYSDGSEIGEIRALNGDQSQFEDILKEMLTPIEDSTEVEPQAEQENPGIFRRALLQLGSLADKLRGQSNG